MNEPRAGRVHRLLELAVHVGGDAGQHECGGRAQPLDGPVAPDEVVVPAEPA